MAQESAPDQRRQLEAQLIEKAARDTAFRAELLRDPKDVIERELSSAGGSAMRLPATVTVVVHEETADTFHLVLPEAPKAGELSDVELAAVAGGKQQEHWITAWYGSNWGC